MSSIKFSVAQVFGLKAFALFPRKKKENKTIDNSRTVMLSILNSLGNLILTN